MACRLRLELFEAFMIKGVHGTRSEVAVKTRSDSGHERTPSVTRPGLTLQKMGNRTAKRIYDVAFTALGLLLLAPLFLLISILVKLSDGGPIFFRQKRVGQYGRIFWIWKFRTMTVDAERTGPSITKAGDPRITALGKILRRTKLDELPQLWNVLRGDMSLVGPRPEVPHYMDRYSVAQRQILSLKPGITDLATLKFRNEEELLRSAQDVEAFYLQCCVPRKLELNLHYASEANLWTDTQLIFQTLFLAGEANAVVRYLVVLLTYSAAMVFSLWLSYELRFDFSIPRIELELLRMHLYWIVPLKLIFLMRIGQSSGLLTYFNIRDFRHMLSGLGAATILLFGIWYLTSGIGVPPRGVILADFIISSCSLASIRLFFRLLRENYISGVSSEHRQSRRIGIIGAGDVGTALARELSIKRGVGPVAFFDDDRGKWGSHIHDIPVVGSPESLAENRNGHRVAEVIIAMPSAGGKRLQEIVHMLHRASLPFQTVPSLDELATGRVKVTKLRRVEIEDLLDGEPVNLDLPQVANLLLGKTVLVTGAGGSVGSELCKQLFRYAPSKLLVLDRSEVQLFALEQELLSLGYETPVVPLVADILDGTHLQHLFRLHRPQIVFHAAAHKQVPMMELQPSEAIKNNVFGTVQLAEVAAQFQVESFVLISTHNAVSPSSVVAASKRLAEMFIQSFQVRAPAGTKFTSIRFGNLLSSTGSVIPTFNRQIAAGGPVTVTHPEAARSFMTIREAASLVLQSAAQSGGGEIFQLEMGKPIKIVDLVRQLIELRGLRPEIDIPIEYIGLRPGEELSVPASAREQLSPTPHPKIVRVSAASWPLEDLKQRLAGLKDALYGDPDKLKALLKQVIPESDPAPNDSCEE